MNPRRIVLTVMLLLLAQAASAITLQWYGGGTNINFTEATRCTLVVSVALPDTALPADLRLSWVAQDCPDIVVVAEREPDPFAAESRVDEVIDRSHLESGATFRNVLLALASPHCASARYILDLPAGARGKIRVQAARPGSGFDRSNVVTFNSGVSAAFAPVVFGSKTVIEGNSVVVHARGVGLGEARGVRLLTGA